MHIPEPASRRAYAAAGYSLLEMVLVLLILSLLAGFFLTARIAVLMDERTELTNKRMDEIERGLLWFRKANHRLPCPGRAALTIATTNYGREASTPGTCIGAISADFTATNIAAGAIPTKSIGISDEYMYDGFGRKFTYAVDLRATSTCAMTTYTLTDAVVGFEVRDSTGSARTTKAWYAIISHGMNGHGGYLPNGTRYNANSTNSNEQLNCHCNSLASSTGLTAIFVDRDLTESSSSPTNRFDDILRYGLRSTLLSKEDESGNTETCP